MQADFPRAWIIAGIAGTALTTALLLFLAPEIRDTLAAAHATKIAPSMAMRVDVPTVQTTRIVPAEVLSTAVQWAPLTGDGSN